MLFPSSRRETDFTISFDHFCKHFVHPADRIRPINLPLINFFLRYTEQIAEDHLF